MTPSALAAVLLTLLGTGLMAGTFFTWSNAVMPGLNAVAPRQAIAAMRAMNTAILNPRFLAVFVLIPVVGVIAAVLLLMDDRGGAAGYMFTAAGVYLLGGAGITAAINVPMNNAIDAATIPDDDEQATVVWTEFSARWTRWNTIRGLSCAVSCAVCGVGLYVF